MGMLISVAALAALSVVAGHPLPDMAQATAQPPAARKEAPLPYPPPAPPGPG